MAEKEQKEEPKLKGKMRIFADFYLGDALFNGTKSARLAGYEGNDNTLAATASRMLRNVKVSAYIEEKLTAHGMGANEVIARLAMIARGDVNDLLNNQGYFDINVARKNEKTYLIKKLKTKRTLKQKKTEVTDNMRTFLAEDEIEPIETDVEIIYEEVEFEIADSHGALRDIGKIHKLFVDRTELSGTVQNVGMTIDEFKQQAAERLAKANETLEKFNE